MQLWFQASRPQTLPAGLAPVLIGLALACREQDLSVITAALTMVTTMLLQISSNLINDYYDGVKGSDTVERLGPKRVTASGLIAPDQVKNAFRLTLLLSFICGLYLMYIGGLPIVLIGLLSLFTAWAYTGGPYPLSYYGLGEVFALLFFGPVAVWGTFYIQKLTFHLDQHQHILIWGISIGLLASALMGINNLRDIEQDLKASKTTLATILGQKRMRVLIILFVVVSNALAYSQLNHYAFIVFIPFFLFIGHWRAILTGATGSALNHHLALTGKYLFIFSILCSTLLLIAK